MQVELDRYGRKVIGYGRPYIEFDEIQRNYRFFDPNHSVREDYGLYTQVRPTSQRWPDYTTRYFRTTPFIPTGDQGRVFRYQGRR